jgi:hypothetical protein
MKQVENYNTRNQRNRGLYAKKLDMTNNKDEGEETERSTDRLNKDLLMFRKKYLGEVMKRLALIVIFWLPLFVYSLYRDYITYKEHSAYTEHLVSNLDLRTSLEFLHVYTYQMMTLELSRGASMSQLSVAEQTLLLSAIRRTSQVQPSANGVANGDSSYWFSSYFNEYGGLYETFMEKSLCVGNLGLSNDELTFCNSNTFLRSGLQTALYGAIETARNLTAVMEEASDKRSAGEHILLTSERLHELGKALSPNL